MLKMLALLTFAITASFAHAAYLCDCFTSTTSITPAFCSHDGEICETPQCNVPVTTTVFVAAINPLCITTPTVTYELPCCGGSCPKTTVIETVDHICKPTFDAEIAALTSSPVVTAMPDAVLEVSGKGERHERRKHLGKNCYATELFGAQDVITKTVCQVDAPLITL